MKTVFGGGGKAGERTLFNGFLERVVGGEDLFGCFEGWVVGGDGFDEGVDGGFDAVELCLEDGVHGDVGAGRAVVARFCENGR